MTLLKSSKQVAAGKDTDLESLCLLSCELSRFITIDILFYIQSRTTLFLKKKWTWEDHSITWNNALCFKGQTKLDRPALISDGVKQVHKRLGKPLLFSLFWRWTLTTHDLAMVNFIMEFPAVDVFVCCFPWDRVVDECHKVLTVIEKRSSFCLLGCRVQSWKKVLERSLGNQKFNKKALQICILIHLMISNPTAEPQGENQAPMARWHLQGEREESTTQGNLLSIIWKLLMKKRTGCLSIPRSFIYWVLGMGCNSF